MEDGAELPNSVPSRKRKRWSKKCCWAGCDSKYSGSSVRCRFWRMPSRRTRPEVFVRWLELSGRREEEMLGVRYVCSRHFPVLPLRGRPKQDPLSWRMSSLPANDRAARRHDRAEGDRAVQRRLTSLGLENFTFRNAGSWEENLINAVEEMRRTAVNHFAIGLGYVSG